MDVEERLRKVENTLSFLKGTLIAGVAAAVIYYGVTSFYQIPSQISKEIDKQIGDNTRTTISKALEKADEFLAHDVHNKWPDGTYAILKSGPCPSNFKAVGAYAKAFSVYKRSEDYLKPAQFGDSKLVWHAPDKNHVELHLVVCIKEK